MARLQIGSGGSTKEEEPIKLSNFMGVDFTNTKLNVAPNRAVEMENLIYENGINHKRNGWNEVLKASGKVNGCWKYIAPNKSVHTIVHIGTKLYRVFARNGTTDGFDENSAYTKATDITPLGATITDEISYGIMNDEKLYLLCGSYLVYNGTNFKQVANDTDTYIPTTTIGIGAVGSELYRGTSFERINLLSNFEKVTIYSEDTFNGSPLGYGNEQQYNLPRPLLIGTETDVSKLVKITIDTIEENETVTIDLTCFLDDGKIQLNRGLTWVGELDGNKLYMGKHYPLALEGKPNITITYKTREVDYTIDKCTFGTLLNAQGGQFLFLSGNPDKLNMDWHSDYGLGSTMKSLSDFTYFPDLSYTAIGNHTEKNIGYTLLGNGTMAIHKDTNSEKDILYIRTSYLGDALSPSGEVVKSLSGEIMKEVYFPINQSAVGEGMIARNTSANLLGDNLFLSRNGVFGLSLAQNITSSERYALDRSGLINGRLTKESNLDKAVGIAFNNRYYLAINGNCYVADARYKNYISTDMPDTFSYEWWFWTNIPARIFFVRDNELYFGTDKGQICKFIEGNTHNDITYVEVDTLTHEDGSFILPLAYTELIATLKDGDSVRIMKANETDLTYNLYDTTYPLDFECEIMDYNDGSFKLYSHTIDGIKQPYDVNISGEIKGYFVIKERVDDLFMGYISDLGTPTHTKKITSITVTPEKITNSTMQVGVRTRNFNERYVEVDNAGLFDFEELDFANFTFNTDDFATSFTKKTRLKCNYAQFMYKSTNDRNCGLHSVVVNYKIIKKNKGER